MRDRQTDRGAIPDSIVPRAAVLVLLVVIANLPAFGGGFGSPGYGFIEAVDTRVSGMTVESLPHSKMAAYTKVPSVTSARGSSPAMLITAGALARLAGL